MPSGALAATALDLTLALALAGGGCASVGEWRVFEARRLEEYAGAARPAMVVDIDDTLVDGGTGSSIRLLLGLGHRRVPPFAAAPATLRALGERWDVVLLTARDDGLAERTLEWLETSGFPRLPVIFSSSWLLTARSREAFKRCAIERLKASGVRVEIGIGDKPDDLLAYDRCGLRTILVLDGPRDRDLPRTLEALGTTSLGVPAVAPAARHGQTPQAPWLVLFSRERCWREILLRATGMPFSESM